MAEYSDSLSATDHTKGTSGCPQPMETDDSFNPTFPAPTGADKLYRDLMSEQTGGETSPTHWSQQQAGGMPLLPLVYPSQQSGGTMPCYEPPPTNPPLHPPNHQPPYPNSGPPPNTYPLQPANAAVLTGSPVQHSSQPPNLRQQQQSKGSSSKAVQQQLSSQSQPSTGPRPKPRKQNPPPSQPQDPPFSSSSSLCAELDSPSSSDLPGSLEERHHQQQKQQEQGQREKEGDKEYTVLIIGKTGNGKSSLGNTLTGVKSFKVGRGMFVTTQETQAVSATVGGRRLKVIDTADFTNIRTDASTATAHVHQWQKHTGGGNPDVIIMVVRCDVRYTKEEHDIYREIVKLWGDDSLFRRRLMVAFTIGDLQDDDLGEELKTVCKELKSVLTDAQNRYVQVNNRERDEEEKRKQLQKICKVISDVIRHGDVESALLIIGKTGHGKSSLGNFITGRNSFTVGPGLTSVTRDATVQTARVLGRGLKVIDTPDLRHLSGAEKWGEIEKWKELTEGRPVFLLLVLRCDVRVTSDELAVYNDVTSQWRDLPLIVVFTFADRLDFELRPELDAYPTELRAVLAKSANTFLLVYSKGMEEQRRQSVLRSLLAQIDHRKGGAARRTPASTANRGGQIVSQASARVKDAAVQLVKKVKSVAVPAWSVRGAHHSPDRIPDDNNGLGKTYVL